MVPLFSSTDKATAWNEYRFISWYSSDFLMIVSLSIAGHVFTRRILTSLSFDETLLLSYVNLSTNFRGTPLRVDTAPPCLKHIFSL